jgi:hypothetical protein
MGRLLTMASIGLVVSCGGLVVDDHAPARAPQLRALSSSAAISPPFDAATHDYTAELSVASLLPLPTVTLAAVPDDVGSRVSVGGVPLPPGTATAIPVSIGKSVLDVTVSSPNGTAPAHYTIRLAVHVASEITYFKASNTLDRESFATALAADGDTLAVGNPWDPSGASGVGADPFDTSAIRAGAVFMYERRGGTWMQDAYIKAPNAHAEQDFGRQVALRGDTLVVGAPGDTSGTGAAFVYRRTNGAWAFVAELVSPSPVPWSRFGMSVALGDGIVAVGALIDPTDAAGLRGGVDLYGPSGSGPSGETWTHLTRVPSPVEGVTFGQAIAFSGDTLAISAVGESSPPSDQGVVHLYTNAAGTWTESAHVSGAPIAYHYGDAIGLSGDTLVVGVAYANSGVSGDPKDTSTPHAGGVFVYRHSGGTWAREAYLTSSTPRANAAFGASLSFNGDVLAVGAPGEGGTGSGLEADPGGSPANNTGAAYVFSRSGTTWTQRAYLKATNPRESASFGSSIALGSSALVVGAPQEGTLTRGIDGPQAPSDACSCGAAYAY